MNWEAVSAIGELIGAGAIIISLVYLAYQLRQNTHSIKLAALQSTMDRWIEWSGVLATTPDLAQIVHRGNANYHSLDPAEALRYGAYVQMFFDAVENYHTQLVDIGIGGDESVLESIVRRRIVIPGFAQWWQENTGDYDAGFVAMIERIRGSSSECEHGTD